MTELSGEKKQCQRCLRHRQLMQTIHGHICADCLVIITSPAVAPVVEVMQQAKRAEEIAPKKATWHRFALFLLITAVIVFGVYFIIAGPSK